MNNMFGKIRDKLKNVFKSSEEIIEESPDEVVEVEEQVEDKIEEEKSVKNKESKPKEKREKISQKELDIIEEAVEDAPLGRLKKKEVEEVEEPEPEKEEEPKKKKGFFSKVFGSKDEEEEKEIEKVQDNMLEDVSKEEKDAIKDKKELPTEEIEENKEQLEEKVEKEEQVEKEEGFFSKAVGALKKKKITDEDFEKIWVELEVFLLEINVAYEIVEKIQERLREELIDNSFDRFKLSEKIREVLESEVEKVLKDREASFLDVLNDYKSKGEVLKILVLGVNGTGKTTSIAKIVRFMQKNEFKVVVAAADTFRAAAVEQLEEHAKKLDFKLVQHKGGSDPAAVAYDAIEHANAKKLDVVLIDTAGRMPNNSNLMMELQKVKRVSGAQMAVFVGDSISGNDLIDQIELFDKGVSIDGVILTKVDTDERPGSIITTAYSIEKPIYFLGIGQNYDDLVEFNAQEVAHKLFSLDDE